MQWFLNQPTMPLGVHLEKPGDICVFATVRNS